MIPDLDRVISGGQTGADVAALKAARAVGIPTGGWLPKGFITLEGPRPEYVGLYGMQECSRGGYPTRTELNVRDSDGTLRFARDFKSPGERCTLKNIKWHGRPYFDVDIDRPALWNDVWNWIGANNVRVLNVAGNSEETAPGIGDFVYGYLFDLLPRCLSEGKLTALLTARGLIDRRTQPREQIAFEGRHGTCRHCLGPVKMPRFIFGGELRPDLCYCLSCGQPYSAVTPEGREADR